MTPRRDVDDEHQSRLEELGIEHILAAVGKLTTRGESRGGSAGMMRRRGRPMTAARTHPDSDRQMHLGESPLYTRTNPNSAETTALDKNP